MIPSLRIIHTKEGSIIPTESHFVFFSEHQSSRVNFNRLVVEKKEEPVFFFLHLLASLENFQGFSQIFQGFRPCFRVFCQNFWSAIFLHSLRGILAGASSTWSAAHGQLPRFGESQTSVFFWGMYGEGSLSRNFFRKAVGFGIPKKKQRRQEHVFFDFERFGVTKKVYIDILHHLVSPKSKSYLPKQAIGIFELEP